MSDYSSVALSLATALTNRDYASAYAMTSSGYQGRISADQMREAFEALVPADFGDVASVAIGLTMDSWPDKHAEDVGWAYVSIGGDVYSEALTIVVTMEGGAMKVRDVEFGRP